MFCFVLFCFICVCSFFFQITLFFIIFFIWLLLAFFQLFFLFFFYFFIFFVLLFLFSFFFILFSLFFCFVLTFWIYGDSWTFEQSDSGAKKISFVTMGADTSNIYCHWYISCHCNKKYFLGHSQLFNSLFFNCQLTMSTLTVNQKCYVKFFFLRVFGVFSSGLWIDNY